MANNAVRRTAPLHGFAALIGDYKALGYSVATHEGDD